MRVTRGSPWQHPVLSARVACLYEHASELEDPDAASAQSEAFLAEQGRSWRFQAHRCGQQRQQGKQRDERQRAEDDVRGALRSALQAAMRVGEKIDQRRVAEPLHGARRPAKRGCLDDEADPDRLVGKAAAHAGNPGSDVLAGERQGNDVHVPLRDQEVQTVEPVRLIRVDVPGNAPVARVVGRRWLHDARRVCRAADDDDAERAKNPFPEVDAAGLEGGRRWTTPRPKQRTTSG